MFLLKKIQIKLVSTTLEDIRAKAEGNGGFQACSQTQVPHNQMAVNQESTQIPFDNLAATRDPRLSRRMAQIEQFMETQKQTGPTSSKQSAKEEHRTAEKLTFPPLPMSSMMREENNKV